MAEPEADLAHIMLSGSLVRIADLGVDRSEGPLPTTCNSLKYAGLMSLGPSWALATQGKCAPRRVGQA